MYILYYYSLLYHILPAYTLDQKMFFNRHLTMFQLITVAGGTDAEMKADVIRLVESNNKLRIIIGTVGLATVRHEPSFANITLLFSLS